MGWSNIQTPFRIFLTRKTHTKVGFIGLGKMGYPMAKNLLAANDVDLKVFDVRTTAADGGLPLVHNVLEIGNWSDVILTMLPSGSIMKQVLYDQGLLLSMKKGALLIDCSTVDPNDDKEFHAAALQNNIHFLDAPVSGGVKGAEEGTLTFLVGGRYDDFERGKLILQKMGKKIILCGGPGSGQIMKICNNMVLGISMIALSEAINLAENCGVDPLLFSEVINSCSGRSWASEVYNPLPGFSESSPASNNYRPGFSNELILKDLKIAQELACTHDSQTPLGKLCYSVYEKLTCDKNYQQKDFSSVIQFLKNKVPK